MSAPAEDPKADGHGEGEEKPKGALAGKLPLLFAVVNTVAILGLAGFVIMSRGKEDPKADKNGKGKAAAVASEAAHEAEGEGAAGAEASGEGKEGGEAKEGGGAEKATLIVSLGGFIINLKDPGGEHYLKCKIGMEVEGEGEAKKEAEGMTSRVRYEVNMILSDLRVVDVSGPEKIEVLRKVMLQKAKKALAPKLKVVGIWPEEWVIQ